MVIPFRIPYTSPPPALTSLLFPSLPFPSLPFPTSSSPWIPLSIAVQKAILQTKDRNSAGLYIVKFTLQHSLCKDGQSDIFGTTNHWLPKWRKDRSADEAYRRLPVYHQ